MGVEGKMSYRQFVRYGLIEKKTTDSGFEAKKQPGKGKRKTKVEDDDASLMLDDTKENILGTDDSFTEELPQKNVKKRRGRKPSVSKNDGSNATGAGKGKAKP